MDMKEKKLSDYIDSLNAEQKPEQSGHTDDSPELAELLETVKTVRSLREPSMPAEDYPKKLAGAVHKQLVKSRHAKKRKRMWLAGAAAAAVFTAAILIGLLTSFNGSNMVYAMEAAYRNVKAYHGFLQIEETNGAGRTTVQAKLEVWADSQGRYYVKGLEGAYGGLLTVNNGQSKWQVLPHQKQVRLFPAFPDPYRFGFDLGKEIDAAGNAISTKTVGEETVAGRAASILEVTPQGGSPYRIWVDKETNLPIQKQYAMQNSIQYSLTYTNIEFKSSIPEELINFKTPSGYTTITENPELIVKDLEEAAAIVGFTPKMPQDLPDGFSLDSIAVSAENKLVKLYYASSDKQTEAVFLQKKATEKFDPAPTAVLGKIGSSVAEIQSPVQSATGILAGGPYAGITDISSIRWQQDGFEYAVTGDASLQQLSALAAGISNNPVEMPLSEEQDRFKPQIEVPVDLEVERNEQKSADAGHSAWRLDPVFTAQVFASLKLSPGGITGDYPIKTEDLKITQNTGNTAIIEISGDITPVSKIYLKRLVRQDATGIWTVVGYDPKK